MAQLVTRDMPRLSLRASFEPSTVDVEKRTVDITWTTGARVLRRGWDGSYFEELSLDAKHVRMGRLESGAAPLLDSHHSYGIDSIIGVVESAKLEKKRGTARVRFDSGAKGEEAFRMVREGTLRNVSVGYSTYKMQKIEDGSTTTPVYRSVDWEPAELSLLAIGADAGAGTRSGGSTTPCEFIEPTKEVTIMPKPTETNEPTPITPVPAPAPAEALAAAATRAAVQARAEHARALSDAVTKAAEEARDEERVRATEIREIGKLTGLGDDWANSLIDGGVTVEAARRAAFEYKFKADANIDGHNPLLSAGDDMRDKFVRGASAWIFERTGQRKMLEDAKAKAPDLFKGVSFDGGEFRGYSPVELARLSLERRGVRTSGMDKMTMIGLAFTYRGGGGSYQTTSDFSTMLENALHKLLLGAYQTQESTWQRFCGTEQVPDFRESSRYRTGALPSLQTIAEHAEYPNAAISDASKYTIKTQRKGEIFGVSQEAIVNDDMGALANLAVEIGRAAQRTLEEDVYALLAQNAGLGPTMPDTNPLFHSTRANVGTSSVLGVTGIDLDASLMNSQKDPNGKSFINLQPSVLVVPRTLRGAAQVINDAQYDPDTANKMQRPNAVRGLFDDIVGTPYLAASSARRYLFANPAIAAAIVIAYLEGYGTGPVMTSRDGWRIDGVEWKATMFARAQVADPKAAVTNAGG